MRIKWPHIVANNPVGFFDPVLWNVTMLKDEVYVSDRWRHHSSFNRDNEVLFQIDFAKVTMDLN